MFVLARLRATVLFFLIFSPCLAYARDDVLFTSSITYCDPPETLLVQKFEVAYFPKNNSVAFNVSAASVEPNVNVTANLLLNVYGLHPVNITLDFCSIFGGALCPLPMYNFTGADSVVLPQSLGITEKIPKIAFQIPDLEGYAQLRLAEIGTGKTKACIQATLSNGWSTRQPAVEWTTGGIAIAVLVLAVWLSLYSDSIFVIRMLDLLFFYQFIASSALLSLNYPSVYRSFALNFAWSIGLFATSASSKFQQSIDRMRHLTGGKLAYSTSAAAVGFVNRRLSPYNADPPPTTLAFPNRAAAGAGVQIVTPSSQNVLQAGIPIYVNSIRIPTANAFMTLFLSALILVASVLATFILAYLGFTAYDRARHKKAAVQSPFRYWPFVKAWSIRLGFFLFYPITILSFYQWTLRDSWLSILLSVLAFAATLCLVLFPTAITLYLGFRLGSDTLYSDRHIASKGPLYFQYRPQRFWFFFPLLFASFLRAIFIAFAKGSGEAQIILMVILEGFIVIAHLVFRPCRSKGGDVFSTFLAVIRLVGSGLMISFIQHLNVNPITRVVIGIVLLVIFSVTLLVIYLNLLLNSGIHCLWRRSAPTTSQLSGNELMVETGTGPAGTRTNSSELAQRPTNPTPERSPPMDPQYLQPFPITPTDTEQPSAYSRDSGSMTVGSLLSRRWSITPLGSPTDTISPVNRSSQMSHSHFSSDHNHESLASTRPPTSRASQNAHLP